MAVAAWTESLIETVPSPSIITLFSSQRTPRRDSASMIASALTHVVVLGLAVQAILHAPQILREPTPQRYTVRLLKIQRSEPQVQWSPGNRGAKSPVHSVARADRPGGRLSAPAPAQQLIRRIASTRTLIQPKAPQNPSLLADAPIPAVVLWRPENAPTPKIVLPPSPPKPVVADVKPSIAMPNHETEVADMELTSTTFASATLPVVASTTSPIAIHLPGVAAVPQSASNANAQATPTALMSVSDVLVARGTVALPLVDETGPMSDSESLRPGRPDSSANAGRGVAAGNRNGSGGTSEGQAAAQSAANGPSGTNAGQLGSGSGSSAGLVASDRYAVDRISLPRNGQFGVVVVGASLADQYPETVGMWAGRMAYTVYLHVGLTKNWILQYSLPPHVKIAGNVARPNPPWPYLMVRPHLLPDDWDADAIMVHGFIDSGGHFEKLAVVFPPEFAQTKFVLASLKQWEFRPATENGQLTPVEVLLIIPEESD